MSRTGEAAGTAEIADGVAPPLAGSSALVLIVMALRSVEGDPPKG